MSRLIPYGVSAWGDTCCPACPCINVPIRWAHPTQRNAVLYQLSAWNVRAVSACRMSFVSYLTAVRYACWVSLTGQIVSLSWVSPENARFGYAMH